MVTLLLPLVNQQQQQKTNCLDFLVLNNKYFNILWEMFTCHYNLAFKYLKTIFNFNIVNIAQYKRVN